MTRTWTAAVCTLVAATLVGVSCTPAAPAAPTSAPPAAKATEAPKPGAPAATAAAPGTKPAQQGSGRRITIGLSYQAAPSDSDPWHFMAQRWQTLLKDRTGGNIELQLFP